MEDVNIIGLVLFFGGCLAIIFVFRLVRENKAKKQAQSPDGVKLYLAGSKKTISDGVKVELVNGKKPTVGRDTGGNYVVLRQGDNTISASFISLKDFAPAAAMPTLAPAIINSKKKGGEIECSVKAGTDYMLDFDKERGTFIVEEMPVKNIGAK